MRAVLLFSAFLHIAVIGALAAFATRWLFASRRSEEPTFPEYVKTAAALGGCVFVVGTIVMWLGRGFGTAVTAGLAGGLIAALSFLLALGVLPNPWSTSTEPPSFHARVSNASLVAALVLTEVIAFCLLVATAGTTAPFS
jgi:hypothetical protein